MPVSPNNLQFSLSSEYLEKLRALSKEGESLGLTAKRILTQALDSSQTVNTFEETITLESIQDRVEAIEVAIEAEHYPDRSQELREYCSRLTALEYSNGQLKTEVEALRRLVYAMTSPVKKR